MVEPPTLPDPEEYPEDSFVCGHEDAAGRAIDIGQFWITLRCGRCGAPLAQRATGGET